MNLTELYFSNDRYNFISGYGDKGTAHSYIQIYQDFFEPVKNEKLNILEIGIMNGHSIRLWKDYFINSNLTGVDISHYCSQYKEDRIDIIIEDATSKSFADRFTDEFFDIIIDDGSHLLDHQITSFINLYPKLKKGGIYFIEDILDLDYSRQHFEKLNPSKIFDLRSIKNEKTDALIYWEKKQI